jgi:hypothetical protein
MKIAADRLGAVRWGSLRGLPYISLALVVSSTYHRIK